MCLAIPGKIVKIENGVASVDYGSEVREAKIVQGDYSVGDFVIVSAQIVSDKVPAEQVGKWLEIVKNDR